MYKAMITLRNQNCLIIWIKSTSFNGEDSMAKIKRQIVNGLLFGMGNFQTMLADTIKKDLLENFWLKAQIYELGEYLNGFRIGKWKYFNNNESIGGGFYKNQDKKTGKWIEMDEGFYKCKQVTHKGEYNMNGLKIGRWDIMNCKGKEKEYKEMQILRKEEYIVVVDYMIQKEIRKRLESGYKWIGNIIQITYNNGEYNMKGEKAGNWVKMYVKENKKIGDTKYIN
ncbi:unnamed protein product [Paramecium sonneborni]|uniref:MORN repeat protein n=1 Tax=Paramecium sonneborni TaxID=65129 RepID=A0A8S1RUT4_9CILI|nr:unnamed protein product [Paramecium sonneborni]